MNPYDILGVNKNATFDEIKQKYRQLANENHPDKGGNIAKFQEINNAYQILSDPFRRKSFDNDNSAYIDNTMYQEAKQMMLRVFWNQLSVHNPEINDLIFNMRREVEQSQSQMKDQIKDNKKDLEKFEKVKKKLKMKQRTEDILYDSLEERIYNININIMGLTRRIQVFDFILLILGNYYYNENELMELLASTPNE
jgi:curved DNA-binding protein CbpA